jgi:hypothetical protein
VAAPIFISHAAADANLADAVYRLLKLGADATQKQIFCSSVPETGIPTGATFVDHIRDRMAGASLVVYLVTPSWQESAFCLCELGAGWALGHRPFPLLVSPIGYADLDAVLTGVQAARIDDAGELDKLFDAVTEILGTRPATAGWTRHRDEFLLEARMTLLPNVAAATRVAASEHQAALNLAERRGRELGQATGEIGVLNSKLTAMAAEEPGSARKQILVADNERQEFDALVAELEQELRLLPWIVVDVLFHRVAGHDFTPDDWSDVEREVANGFLTEYEADRGPVVAINTSDPRVRRAYEAARVLADYSASSELKQAFEDEHDLDLDFGNRRVWVALGMLQ